MAEQAEKAPYKSGCFERFYTARNVLSDVTRKAVLEYPVIHQLPQGLTAVCRSDRRRISRRVLLYSDFFGRTSFHMILRYG